MASYYDENTRRHSLYLPRTLFLCGWARIHAHSFQLCFWCICTYYTYIVGTLCLYVFGIHFYVVLFCMRYCTPISIHTLEHADFHSVCCSFVGFPIELELLVLVLLLRLRRLRRTNLSSCTRLCNEEA